MNTDLRVEEAQDVKLSLRFIRFLTTTKRIIQKKTEKQVDVKTKRQINTSRTERQKDIIKMTKCLLGIRITFFLLIFIHARLINDN